MFVFFAFAIFHVYLSFLVSIEEKTDYSTAFSRMEVCAGRRAAP